MNKWGRIKKLLGTVHSKGVCLRMPLGKSRVRFPFVGSLSDEKRIRKKTDLSMIKTKGERRWLEQGRHQGIFQWKDFFTYPKRVPIKGM